MSRKTELVVELIGEDSNIFALCGKVTKALKRGGYYEHAKELPEKLNDCESYSDALALLDSYVEIA